MEHGVLQNHVYTLCWVFSFTHPNELLLPHLALGNENAKRLQTGVGHFYSPIQMGSYSLIKL